MSLSSRESSYTFDVFLRLEDDNPVIEKAEQNGRNGEIATNTKLIKTAQQPDQSCASARPDPVAHVRADSGTWA
jgi:hypothetical protein